MPLVGHKRIIGHHMMLRFVNKIWVRPPDRVSIVEVTRHREGVCVRAYGERKHGRVYGEPSHSDNVGMGRHIFPFVQSNHHPLTELTRITDGCSGIRRIGVVQGAACADVMKNSP